MTTCWCSLAGPTPLPRRLRAATWRSSRDGSPCRSGAIDPTGFALIDHGEPRPLDAQTRGVIGGTANLLVSRAALAAVGGFDERLGPGRWLSAGEDLDLLDRIVEAGMTGWYEPAAVVECEQWREGAARARLAWAYGKGMGARFAAMTRRSPSRALRRWNELLRLGGLLTAVRRRRERSRCRAPRAEPSSRPGRQWSEPVLWRLGAIVGFVAALPLRRWTGPRGVSNTDGAERIDVVTVHLPQRHGRAAERALFAWVEGARPLGADVCVTSWSSYEPREELPGVVRAPQRCPPVHAPLRHIAALRRPRSDARLLDWQPRPGAWAVADDVVSVAAVAGRERSVMVAHYATVLDQWAVRRAQLRHVQDARHERRAAAAVRIPTAYSARVARHFGHGTAVIPIALADHAGERFCRRARRRAAGRLDLGAQPRRPHSVVT